MTYFKTPPTLSLMQLFYVVCYTYFRLFLLLLLCDQFYVFLTDNSGISYGKGYGFQVIYLQYVFSSIYIVNIFFLQF